MILHEICLVFDPEWFLHGFRPVVEGGEGLVVVVVVVVKVGPDQALLVPGLGVGGGGALLVGLAGHLSPGVNILQ